MKKITTEELQLSFFFFLSSELLWFNFMRILHNNGQHIKSLTTRFVIFVHSEDPLASLSFPFI